MVMSGLNVVKKVLGFFNTYNTAEKLKQKISEIPIKKSEELNIIKLIICFLII